MGVGVGVGASDCHGFQGPEKQRIQVINMGECIAYLYQFILIYHV